MLTCFNSCRIPCHNEAFTVSVCFFDPYIALIEDSVNKKVRSDFVTCSIKGTFYLPDADSICIAAFKGLCNNTVSEAVTRVG